MSKEEHEAIVIGAGVIGLTTAIRLAEAGFSIRVRAAEPPARTTSRVAGAIWGSTFAGAAGKVTGVGFAWGCAREVVSLLEG